jgi:hypothetical protein
MLLHIAFDTCGLAGYVFCVYVHQNNNKHPATDDKKHDPGASLFVSHKSSKTLWLSHQQQS